MCGTACCCVACFLLLLMLRWWCCLHCAAFTLFFCAGPSALCTALALRCHTAPLHVLPTHQHFSESKVEQQPMMHNTHRDCLDEY
jgi:hypothetical protein